MTMYLIHILEKGCCFHQFTPSYPRLHVRKNNVCFYIQYMEEYFYVISGQFSELLYVTC